jgi:7-cyano-7-deazaguanine synthase
VEQNKIGILFSGGLESTSLINHYKKLNFKIYPVYLKFGYIWEETELLYAKKISDFYNLNLEVLDYSKIINVSQLGKVTSAKQNIIPLRNLSLFTFSSIYFFNINVCKIAIGLQGSDEYPDTSIKYIQDCEKLISQGLQKKFTIETPFYGMDKQTILNNNDSIPHHMIFSCTNPINNKRCHQCYKCKILDNLIRKNEG